ncbi:hypothetical protein QN277_020152 [Acacia crassicarpa]|uniref:Uncharacterized protein n=1 Tax=Acacia crassicarpa TaxID=499986 RepID=A0AAE1JJ54_9FABA|nr:hypothetical protein QN277_020152 [Acacia crassicarpa]
MAEMRAARRNVINGGGLSGRFSGRRLIPQRGQVKMGIVLALLHSLSSAISFTSRCVHFS